jgi:hypothetical protein
LPAGSKVVKVQLDEISSIFGAAQANMLDGSLPQSAKVFVETITQNAIVPYWEGIGIACRTQNHLRCVS